MRGFSFKRAIGVSKVKNKIARTTGIPTTKAGRKRKVERIAAKTMTGGLIGGKRRSAAKPQAAGCGLLLLILAIITAPAIAFAQGTFSASAASRIGSQQAGKKRPGDEIRRTLQEIERIDDETDDKGHIKPIAAVDAEAEAEELKALNKEIDACKRAEIDKSLTRIYSINPKLAFKIPAEKKRWIIVATRLRDESKARLITAKSTGK